jgi:integrase
MATTVVLRRHRSPPSRCAASALAAVSGRVDVRLTAAVPHCRQWRLGTLPRVMSDTQLRSFLASFDRSRPKGRRDYAMALCMGVLGLRAVEVASLQVDDVDAAAGTLRLPSGKVRRDRHCRCRPVCSSGDHTCDEAVPVQTTRSLFVRHRIPVGAPSPAH